jgi:3-deoxy-manno-octulosonate cytidylyltransferase (CMP-KDO synthetase)
MTSTAILIPARYGSTRFPGKPLADLGGKPMIVRTIEGCLKQKRDTFVVTDNYQIADIASKYCKVFFDENDRSDSGTERCAHAINDSMFDFYDLFVNVQGDMPDITPNLIEAALVGLGGEEGFQVSTVYTHMPAINRDNPNVVKMVQCYNECLWFGRGMVGYGKWHLGVYAYTRKALATYPKLSWSIEEEVEQLEQLRWLKNGRRMGCVEVDFKGVEINTPEDVEKWHESRKNLGHN